MPSDTTLVIAGLGAGAGLLLLTTVVLLVIVLRRRQEVTVEAVQVERNEVYGLYYTEGWTILWCHPPCF